MPVAIFFDKSEEEPQSNTFGFLYCKPKPSHFFTLHYYLLLGAVATAAAPFPPLKNFS